MFPKSSATSAAGTDLQSSSVGGVAPNVHDDHLPAELWELAEQLACDAEHLQQTYPCAEAKSNSDATAGMSGSVSSRSVSSRSVSSSSVSSSSGVIPGSEHRAGDCPPTLCATGGKRSGALLRRTVAGGLALSLLALAQVVWFLQPGEQEEPPQARTSPGNYSEEQQPGVARSDKPMELPPIPAAGESAPDAPAPNRIAPNQIVPETPPRWSGPEYEAVYELTERQVWEEARISL